MSRMNSEAAVRDQYNNADKLNTRISLHDRYSENRQPFGDWLFACYDIPRGSRILELGCGTGMMWRGHLDALRDCALILSDLSDGMLNEARRNLGERPELSYERIDIQDIPHADASFDIVIANMMLYHVPDLDRALREVRRVLKPNGTFYCATFGEHGHNWHIARMLGVEADINASFTLQNGADRLNPFFTTIRRVDREDALAITNIDDLVDYIVSTASLRDLGGLSPTQMRAALEANMTNGVLRLPKEYGLFICQ